MTGLRRRLAGAWLALRGRDQEAEDVRRLHEKFRFLAHDRPVHLTRRKLQERAEFLLEELKELVDAGGLRMVDQMMSTDDEIDQDLAAQADALVDLVYVAKSTAVMLGLPWRALWDDVHRANLAKERGVGHRGHTMDLVKPPGWVPPRGAEILADAGYDRVDWVDVWDDDCKIDEELCRDDRD